MRKCEKDRNRERGREGGGRDGTFKAAEVQEASLNTQPYLYSKALRRQVV